MNDIADAFYKLKIYCETEHFKGWDPYDGLNSKIFQAIPLLKKSVLCRLMVIQGFKRCPFNMRRMAFVPKEYNAKGIGLKNWQSCLYPYNLKATAVLAGGITSIGRHAVCFFFPNSRPQ